MLPRTNQKDVPDPNLFNRDGLLHSAANDIRCFRRKPHQTFQRVRRFPFSASLKHLANGDQRQNHCGGFKIQAVHVRHSCRRIAFHLRTGHRKQNDRTPYKRSRRAERNKRIHIRRPVQQTLETADKKPLVNDHHDRRKQKLGKGDPHRVFMQKNGKRKTQHGMPHGQVHQYQQKSNRRNQSAAQSGRLGVFKRMGIGGAGRFALCALQRSAVASLRNRCDHVGGIRRAFDAHRVGEKTDRTGRHARDAGNRFFHTRAACSAAHACNLILLHLRSSIPSRSFHELLQRHNEFIDDCIITVSDIPDNAMPNVTCKQLSVEGVDRCACSRRLRQDIGTVRILLQHALQAADLPLNSIQAIQKLFPLFLRTHYKLLVLLCAARMHRIRHYAHLFHIPPWGIFIIC